MGVKDAVLVSDENDELVPVFLLQLLPPALQPLTSEQMLGKGCVAVVGCGLRRRRAQRWRGEMVKVMGQGTQIRQDFAGAPVDDAMRDGLVRAVGAGCGSPWALSQRR